MLKLAGLLKEGVEEWIDETAPEMEEDGPEAVRKAINDMNDKAREGLGPNDFLITLSADAMIDSGIDTLDKLYKYFADEDAREEFKASLHRGIDDDDDFSDRLSDEDYSYYAKAKEMEELQPSAEEEEYERLPKRMGMGRGASLDETYIDNMKEGLEEAIRSIVREVLAEKKAKTYKGKSMRLGGGGRFAKFVDSLKKSGKSEEQARAIAYKAGVKKYGKGKMSKMAAAGKKREAKKED